MNDVQVRIVNDEIGREIGLPTYALSLIHI